MCRVPESTIEELLLGALASPAHKDGGATGEDLFRATEAAGACDLDTMGALRTLLRKGHVVAQAPNGSQDPVTDPDARFRIGGTPAPAARAGEADPEEKRFGNYTYLPTDLLGRGRWGIVYRGWNEFLRRPAAIKFLSPEHTGNEGFRKNFVLEARLLALLDHPRIVKLYDGGQAPDGAYYLAMEYVEGGTLRDLIRNMGRVPPPLVAKYLYQTVEALAAAHRHGVLHRDVKPENLMMDPDGIKVTDFNLGGFDKTAVPDIPSAFESVASEIGAPPRLVGTLAYMAPERLNGERGDLRSDIYSAGATFYSAAAGGPLFEGIAKDSDIYMSWRWHHTQEPPKPLTERVPGFPSRLWSILARALAKHPAERYPTCEELLEDLAPVRRELLPDEEFAPPTRTRPRKQVRLFGPFVAVLAAGLIALALAFLLALKDSAPRPESAALDAKPAPEIAPAPVGSPAAEEPVREDRGPQPSATPAKLEAAPPPEAFLVRFRAYVPTPREANAIVRLMDAFQLRRRELAGRNYEPCQQRREAVPRTPLNGGPADWVVLLPFFPASIL